MPASRRYVAAPSGSPLPYGLTSAALVIPDGDSHLGAGVMYETLMCATARLTHDECIADLNTGTRFVGDNGKQLVVADAFAVYALHTCSPVGGDMENADSAALERLSIGFNRAVEEGFEANSLGAASDLTPTPGTPVDPLAGLAILEEYAAANYGGLPVLHVTRGTGTLLTHRGAVDRYGQRLETKQGVPVASGGGYGEFLGPVGPEPGDGDTDTRITSDATGRWMRITGAVTIRKGEARTFGARLRKDAGEYVNDYSSLAQQTVVVTAECINAAVLVTAPASFGAADLEGGTP